jgi:subtilisin-like proprotein convertase family protein
MFACFRAMCLFPGWWLVMSWLALAQAASAQAAVQAGADLRFNIADGGMVRNFGLALDEISIKRGDQREARQVAAANMADLLAQSAVVRESEPAAAVPAEIEWVLYEDGAKHTAQTRRYVTRQVVIAVAPGAVPAEIAKSAGLVVESVPAYAPGMAILTARDAAGALEAMARLRAHAQVRSADVMLARWRTKKSIPNDPLFAQQWHHCNTTQGGGVLWIDANVTPVWDTFRGSGVTIGILDDGVQHAHPDLQPNYNTAIDYDFNSIDGDPTPTNLSTDDHGTACAGLAAARGDNGIGICGVAPEATITGFRLIAAAATDQNEADAFGIHNDVIQVKSNSWGAADDGETVEAPGPLATAALANGTATGRGGLGTIYLFAGGNGNDFGDNSNYDGYANSIHTIAVGAVTDDGFQSYYSEPGANLVVCAPSSGGSHHQEIVTTDLTGDGGSNRVATGTADLSDRNYTRTFGGTSAACPVVAGVCALMLQANPGLGWRDVREILLRSARQVHHADNDWVTNAAGLHFNHKYGAGLVDAQAAVAMAQQWVNLGPQTSSQVSQSGLAVAIPDNNSTGITRTFNLTAANLRVEQVTVTVNLNHLNRGDLEVVLTSPAGTSSRLAEQHPDPGNNYANWTFSSVRHWGETAAGNWTLAIRDRHSGVSGTLTSAVLKVYGSTVSTARVVPTAAALVTEGNLPPNSAADPGEAVAVSIGLKNIGAGNGGNLTAALLNVGGVTQAGPAQSYGMVASGGAAVVRTFGFTAGGSCGAACKVILRLEDNGAFIGFATYQIPLGVKTVTTHGGGGITILDQAKASPYPATVTVAGVQGRVQQVTAALTGFTHGYPNDLTVFLKGPDNLSVALFTDATRTPLSGRNFTFDDNAASFLPRAGSPPDGRYRPWDYFYFRDGTSTDFAGSGTSESGYTLGEFNGLVANGSWDLYVEDVNAGGAGSIASWSVTVTAVDCVDNLHLTNSAIMVGEAAGTIQVAVTRTAGREGSATVQYATEPGTAAAGADYTQVAGTLTFAPGETTRSFGIPLVNDVVAEPNETIRIVLSAISGNATAGAAMTGTVTILDDDLSPLETWRQTHFGSPADSGDGADLNDFDHDGSVNLVEYAFGLDPKQPAVGQLPQWQWDGNSYLITFSGLPGVTYAAEWSPTLAPGSWTPLVDTPSGEQHRFSVSTTAGPRCFVRLRVSNP